MPWYPGCPTFFERYPSRVSYEGAKALKEMYPASKGWVNLNREWDEVIRQYEEAMKLL
jgi:hypothetical protein